MRAREFISEMYADPEYHPIPLKLGAYRDHEDPRTGEPYPEHYRDNTELVSITDRLINAGVKPNLMPIKPEQLTATQDWLSNHGSDGPMFQEYADHPVVLDYKGHFYVIDGHHRASRALKAHHPIQVYLFNSRKLKENFDDGKNPGRKGLSRRVGIPQKATLDQLEKIASSSTGERRRMAQWQLNMRRGKAKKK